MEKIGALRRTSWDQAGTLKVRASVLDGKCRYRDLLKLLGFSIQWLMARV